MPSWGIASGRIGRVVVAAGLALSAVAAPVSPASAGTTGTPAAATAKARPYLVLGDSISAGYQPDRGNDRSGGYPREVAAAMKRAGTPVRVLNLACTGEDSATMRMGGKCRYRQGSQQKAALAYLRTHRNTRLITLSVGANDVLRCADRRSGSVDSRCVQRGVRELRTRLTTTLRELRRAAPRARIVVLDYYDPFQVAGYLGDRQRVAAGLVGVLRTQVNVAVRGAARDAGVEVAYVTEPFDDGWARRVELPGHGKVPVRVARICTWTWMCSHGDIHPNDEGHRVIAGAVMKAVRRS